MPYKSDAQRRFFHSKGAKEAGITPSVVKEFDNASRGKKLIERVSEARKRVKQSKPR